MYIAGCVEDQQQASGRFASGTREISTCVGSIQVLGNRGIEQWIEGRERERVAVLLVLACLLARETGRHCCWVLTGGGKVRGLEFGLKEGCKVYCEEAPV